MTKSSNLSDVDTIEPLDDFSFGHDHNFDNNSDRVPGDSERCSTGGCDCDLIDQTDEYRLVSRCIFDSTTRRSASITGAAQKIVCEDVRETSKMSDNVPVPVTATVETPFKQDNDGDNLLMIAILLLYSVNTCLFLIDEAVSFSQINQVNNMWETALMLACASDMPMVVRRLMVAGSIVEAVDRHGNTALHIACKYANLECVRQLLRPINAFERLINKFPTSYQKIPQRLDMPNCDGDTCLHLAARHYLKEGFFESLQIIDLLVRNGANINAQEEKSGKTIFHLGAEGGNKNLLTFLFSIPGVDLEVYTFGGRTAVALADGRGHRDIVAQLEKYGVDMSELEYSDSDLSSDDDDDDDNHEYDGVILDSCTSGVSDIQIECGQNVVSAKQFDSIGILKSDDGMKLSDYESGMATVSKSTIDAEQVREVADSCQSPELRLRNFESDDFGIGTLRVNDLDVY